MTEPLSPDRLLAIDYAPATIRPAFATLLALDARLARIARTTREPLVGQMRLVWWRDALERLDHADAPAEPLLRALQRLVLPTGITGATLATLIEGWEVLLDPVGERSLSDHGDARGERLFAIAGQWMAGDAEALSAAGRGWALADVSANVSSPAESERAAGLAKTAFFQAFSKRWSRTSRPIGALALLQALRMDSNTSVYDFLKLTRFRMTGH